MPTSEEDLLERIRQLERENTALKAGKVKAKAHLLREKANTSRVYIDYFELCLESCNEELERDRGILHRLTRRFSLEKDAKKLSDIQTKIDTATKLIDSYEKSIDKYKQLLLTEKERLRNLELDASKIEKRDQIIGALKTMPLGKKTPEEIDSNDNDQTPKERLNQFTKYIEEYGLDTFGKAKSEVDAIITKHGVNCNIGNKKFYCTLLRLSVVTISYEVCKKLLELGASPCLHGGASALVQALKDQKADYLELLLRYANLEELDHASLCYFGAIAVLKGNHDFIIKLINAKSPIAYADGQNYSSFLVGAVLSIQSPIIDGVVQLFNKYRPLVGFQRLDAAVDCRVKQMDDPEYRQHFPKEKVRFDRLRNQLLAIKKLAESPQSKCDRYTCLNQRPLFWACARRFAGKLVKPYADNIVIMILSIRLHEAKKSSNENLYREVRLKRGYTIPPALKEEMWDLIYSLFLPYVHDGRVVRPAFSHEISAADGTKQIVEVFPEDFVETGPQAPEPKPAPVRYILPF